MLFRCRVRWDNSRGCGRDDRHRGDARRIRPGAQRMRVDPLTALQWGNRFFVASLSSEKVVTSGSFLVSTIAAASQQRRKCGPSV